MARYNEKRISYPKQEKLMTMFCNIVHGLKREQELKNLFKDLFNRQERLMFIRRLMIADELLSGRTYQEIEEHLHCSPSTIARVERWLHFGRGGYQRALRKALK